MSVRLFAALAAALAASAALASSIVPPSDLGEMARTSRAVVLARAGAAEVSHQPPFIFTSTTFTVLRVVSGALRTGQSIVVKTPGGEADGLVWAVSGTPEFTTGRTYLLFLDPRPTGEWVPEVLSYGILEKIAGNSGEALLAPLAGSRDLEPFPRADGVLPEPVGTYHEAPLLDMLHAVAGGTAKWDGNAVLAQPQEVPLVASTLSAPSGCKYMTSNPPYTRWLKPDLGQSVTIYGQAAGDTTSTKITGGGLQELSAAVGVWKSLPGTSLSTSLTYGGTTTQTIDCQGNCTASGQHVPCYNQNWVIFDDPCGEIADLTSCAGTLAVGGPYYSTTSQHTFDGTSWYTIQSWFVVVNNGICLTSSNYTIMLAHELGHGLGFGHTADSSSLMYPTCCNPPDALDQSCAAYTYPGTSSPPNAPTGVGATDGTYSDRVRVTWSSSSGATGYEVYRSTGSDPFAATRIGTPSTTVFDDTGAAQGTTYTYWVKATNAAGASGFSSSDTGFAAPCSAPSTPGLSAPATANSGSIYAVTWTAVSGADTYTVQEAADPSFTGASSFTVAATARSFLHTVSSDTTYYYRVRATDSCGGSTYSSGWSVTRQTTVTAADGAAGSAAAIVAVVAHTDGVGGSAWRSDVALTNPSSAPLPLTLRYKPSGGGTTLSHTLSLKGWQTSWLPDLVAGLFGAGTGRGTLIVEPSASGAAPVVSSRTYSTGADGNLGQGIPAALPSSGGTVVLPGLFQDDAYRTNVGITAGGGTVHATLRLLRGPDGAVGGAVTKTVSALDQQQWSLDNLFPGAARAGVPMSVLVTLDAPAVAWASVVDQVSQDSVFLLGGEPSASWLVPVAAHAPGTGGTYWRTDVSLTNPSDAAVTVAPEYLPEQRSNASGGVAGAAIVVPAHGTRVIADVAGTMFGVANGKGALALTVSNGTVVASSRTYTTRTDGGTLGQGIPAVPVDEVNARDRVLTGVRVVDGNRTNIGLVSSTASGATVRLRLRDAGGAVLGTGTLVEVPPRSLLQVSFSTAFPGVPEPGPSASVEVIPGAPVIAYLSVVDGSSSDPVLVLGR